jgi:hypothetical protein
MLLPAISELNTIEHVPDAVIVKYAFIFDILPVSELAPVVGTDVFDVAVFLIAIATVLELLFALSIYTVLVGIVMFNEIPVVTAAVLK